MLTKKFILIVLTFLSSIVLTSSTRACYHDLDLNMNGETMHTQVKFEFPQLTGKYPVGKTIRHIVDTSRQEPFNPTEKRELMVHIWYPCQSGEIHSHVAYRKDEIDETKASMLRKSFSEEDVKDLDSIYTHAVADEQPLRGLTPYPVILFSHGYLGSMPDDYTAFCEELASHGYIVASVAHTYYARQVVFPDGRKITAAPELFTQQRGPNADEQRMWAEDVQCVLDHLMQYNADAKDKFYDLLDPNRAGIIGHSMGGSTAFRLCMQDPRFKAGVSLDASPWSSDAKVSSLTKPFLFIFAEQTLEDLHACDEELAQKYNMDVAVVRGFRSVSQQEVREDVVIPGLMHGGFSDLLLIKEVPVYKNNKHIINLEAMTGTAEGKKTIQLINKHIVDFFNSNLKYK